MDNKQLLKELKDRQSDYLQYHGWRYHPVVDAWFHPQVKSLTGDLSPKSFDKARSWQLMMEEAQQISGPQ